MSAGEPSAVERAEEELSWAGLAAAETIRVAELAAIALAALLVCPPLLILLVIVVVPTIVVAALAALVCRSSRFRCWWFATSTAIAPDVRTGMSGAWPSADARGRARRHRSSSACRPGCWRSSARHPGDARDNAARAWSTLTFHSPGCSAGSASARRWTVWSPACGPGRAGCWSCAARPASARPRCWSTVGRASGCRVARAAGVESEMELPFAGLHELCAPMLDRPGAASGAAARRAEHGVRLRRGPRTGSLHGGPGGAQPAGRCGRGAAAGVHRRRRAMARPRLRADARVRRPAAAGRAGRRWCSRSARTATSTRCAGLPELALEGIGAHDARVRCWTPRSSGPLDERVRDRIVAEAVGQPAGAARAPARADRGGAGRRASGCPARCRWSAGSSRASCASSSRCPPRRGSCCCSRRPSRSATSTLLRRAAERLGHRADAAAPAEAARPDRDRRPRPVPAPAGALRGLPGGERRPARARIARWPRRPTRARSRPPRVASRPRRRRTRRGRGRGARALRRPRAGPRRARRGGGVPGARGRADPDPARRGGARWRPRRRNFEPARRRPRMELLARRGAVSAGRSCERAQVARLRARDRVRAEARRATRRRCCSRPRGGSNRWTPRLARETYLDALGVGDLRGSPRRRRRRAQGREAARAAPAGPSRHARSTCCSTASPLRFTEGSCRRRRADAAGAAGVHRRALTSRVRPCAGCGWPGRPVAEASSGTTRRSRARHARGRAGRGRRAR